MEKKMMIYKTQDVSFYCGILSEFVDQLTLVETTLINSGAIDISISLEITHNFGEEDVVVRFAYYIPETDQELQMRIDSEKAQINYKRNQYEQLKKELGL